MQAKDQQDRIPGYKGAGHGVWISFPLWRHVMRQLSTQMAEILEWEALLRGSQQVCRYFIEQQICAWLWPVVPIRPYMGHMTLAM